MGGVQASLPLAYSHVMLNELTIRGAFMYPRQAPGDLLTMIATGVLDVSPIHVTSFPLERVNEALEQAAASKGLKYCMLVP